MFAPSLGESHALLHMCNASSSKSYPAELRSVYPKDNQIIWKKKLQLETTNSQFQIFYLVHKKILSTPSFVGEVKPSVPCRRFAACKRSLNLRGSRNLGKKLLPDIFLAYSSTFRCWDLSRRCGRRGTWRRKWERLKAGESNGKLYP